MTPRSPLERARDFGSRYGLAIPIFQAPMAGLNSIELALGVTHAGGMGAMGALLTQPNGITQWATEFRARSAGPFQLNIWIPDPAPARSPENEAMWRAFLAKWGPPVPPDAADARLPEFEAQCEAMLAARPTVISSIMGLFPTAFVERMKAHGVAWFACVTTLGEARQAEAAGADAIVAQGFEAGGHRGSFAAGDAERQAVGLVALLPRLADNVDLPIIAAGGIADGRGVAAALALGASAVQIGTGFLRCPEAQVPGPWADAMEQLEPEETMPTRAFSGRVGRAIETRYLRAAHAAESPAFAPYPIQRALTGAMRDAAVRNNDLSGMQAWAGQAAWLARREPAEHFTRRIWDEARAIFASH